MKTPLEYAKGADTQERAEVLFEEAMRAAWDAATTAAAELYEAGSGPDTWDYYHAAKTAIELLPCPPLTRPCETCKGNAEVCASVPGLRHCEKATRES